MKHVIKPLEAEVKQVDSLIRHYQGRHKDSLSRVEEAKREATEHEQAAQSHLATVEELGQRKERLSAVIETVKTL